MPDKDLADAIKEVTAEDKSKDKPRSPAPKPTRKAVETTVMQLTGFVCICVGTFVCDQCGAQMAERSEKFVQALTDQALRSRWVARLVSSLDSTSGWGMVAMGAYQMVKPVIDHHGGKGRGPGKDETAHPAPIVPSTDAPAPTRPEPTHPGGEPDDGDLTEEDLEALEAAIAIPSPTEEAVS